jgi:FkbM family methyltransferase
MVAIDIGAHVGVHALTLARLVGSHGKVIAFEPAAASFELLRRHIRMNGMTSRIEALHAAVGDRDGSRVLVTDPLGADPGNSFVDRHYLARKRHEIVEVVTLDTFCSRRRLLPALVKIDVEGYEARVLDGARQVLSQRPAPTIVCAVHPWHLEQLGESEAAFFALADELRLTPWTLAREPAVPTGEYREVLLIPQ